METDDDKSDVYAAMQEAEDISRDPNVPSYSSMQELKQALLD